MNLILMRKQLSSQENIKRKELIKRLNDDRNKLKKVEKKNGMIKINY